jgi:DNA-binding response OmpR family regulator
VAAKRVLLIDADGLPRRALAEQLGGLGYAVEQAGSAAAAALAMSDGCDLMVVAGPLADATARDLCRSWRDHSLTAPLALIDQIQPRAELEAEGVLVLAKPIRLADLARTLQQIAPNESAPALAFGGLRFHPVTRELEGGAEGAVRLTEREAAILVYLHGAGSRAVPRDELLAQVLGYSGETATHTLETHIYRLRRKLAAAAVDGPTLVSEGGGYRLAIPG